jgi:hypothetical protein
MFEQLLSIVKEQAGAAIISNPDIPNERNDEAISEVSNSISGGLQNALAGGQFKDVLKLLGGHGGDLQSNPLVNQLSGNAMESIMSKFGLNQNQAGSLVSNLLPGVLQNFISKTNNPNDSSIDLQGIFSSLSGGKTGGLDIQGLLGKVTKGGLDQDGDGDTDLNDVISLFKGGSGTQSSGGGLMDIAKGLFGK